MLPELSKLVPSITPTPRVSHVSTKRPDPGRDPIASPSSRFDSKRADTREDTGAIQSESAGIVADLSSDTPDKLTGESPSSWHFVTSVSRSR